MVEKKLDLITSWTDYKIDPRNLILVFLLSFVVAGQTYLNFNQGVDAIFVSILTTVTTELALARIILKKWIIPKSAFITALGVSLLINSYLLWPYVLTAFLSICIKYILRYKGGHLFNPNNIGVVIVIFTLPQFAVTTPKQWSNGFEVMTIILLLGFVVAYFAKRLDTVIAFLSTFTMIAFVRSFVFGAPLLAALGPLLGASMQLFTFFMMTDPKTTPNTRKGRILFAIFIAIIDGILRIQRIPNAPFYALFISTILFMIPYRLYLTRRSVSNV
ncbi:RnfABCDGE type electron transport complex subunit D [Chengkuizengella sediminis]|nr:RnfABCDGE type electron transport complex subunit D [Chengkuizengella sediminis]